mmetsp:Transcript_10551/g.22269  ORF Transcript_10551/g.22269 Transcript_10551/m.22269 type:complete len:209 (-) Transcript_10551:442-1068(-)
MSRVCPACSGLCTSASLSAPACRISLFLRARSMAVGSPMSTPQSALAVWGGTRLGFVRALRPSPTKPELCISAAIVRIVFTVALTPCSLRYSTISMLLISAPSVGAFPLVVLVVILLGLDVGVVFPVPVRVLCSRRGLSLYLPAYKSNKKTLTGFRWSLRILSSYQAGVSSGSSFPSSSGCGVPGQEGCARSGLRRGLRKPKSSSSSL